jgi:hypothetical protein
MLLRSDQKTENAKHSIQTICDFLRQLNATPTFSFIEKQEIEKASQCLETAINHLQARAVSYGSGNLQGHPCFYPWLQWPHRILSRAFRR